jgi:autotransporter-associated beta strand protein
MTTSRSKHVIAVAALAVCAAFSAHASSAVTRTWDGVNDDTSATANSFFGTAGNWVGDTFLSNGTEIATFNSFDTGKPKNPVWSAADNVSGIVIDNSGAQKWTFTRDNAGTRSITIGADGITLSGAGSTTGTGLLLGTGQTSLEPTALTLNGDQIWTINTGASLVFSGTTFGGSGKITKMGAGTLFMAVASNTNAGGWDVKGGTLVNARGTQGAGADGSLVSVFSGAVYESRTLNNNTAVKMYNGSTFRGNGLDTGNGQKTFSLDTVGDAVTGKTDVTINTVSSTDVLTIAPNITGGTSTGTISVDGPGYVRLSGGGGGASGQNNGTTYVGKWKLTGGDLQLATTNALGNLNGTHAPLEITGGRLRLAGGTTGTITMNPTPLTITGTPTVGMVIERAVTTNTSQNNGNTARTFAGPITMGGATVNFTTGDKLSLAQTATLTLGSVSLSGSPTYSVTNGLTIDTTPANVNLVVTMATVTETVAASGVTKSGNGVLKFLGTNGYTGPTTVSGGTLSFGNSAGLTSSKFSVASGATLELNNGTNSTTWTTKADLAGSGTVQMLNTSQTLALQGSNISPGSSPGILNIAGGAVSLAVNPTDSTDLSQLTIDVAGANGASQPVAGNDYDKIIASAGFTGLNLSKLVVNIAGIANQSDLTGDVFTILQSTTDYTQAGNKFLVSNITINGGTADVGYNFSGGVGTVTLSNVQLVPEPTSLATLALAGVGLLARRRRKA